MTFPFPTFGYSAAGGDADWSTYNGANDKTPVEFSSAAVRYNATVQIDSTRALLVYRGTTAYCRARIATIDGDGLVSYGTEAVLLSATITDCAVDLLDGTHAIVTVEEGGDVKCIAIEFSGTTISTVGSAVSFETINSNHLSIAAISASEFFVAYKGSTTGRVYYGSVSGTTVTAGNGIDFVTATINDTSICKLTSTTAIITIGRSGANDWSAFLIGLSGTTPTLDDTHALWSAALTLVATDVVRISDTQAIATCGSSSGTTGSFAVIIDESGGTLSNGTRVTFDSNIAKYTSIGLPNSTQAVCSMIINGTAMRTTVVTISGSTLTPLTSVVNSSTDREYLSTTQVGTDYVLAIYEDDADASKGKGMVLTP